MPSRPPTPPPSDSRASELLLDFLSTHDAPCPVCGYNLRGLSTPTCPECRHDLVLSVGAARPRLGWLLITLAPGFFSGIAACFVALPTVGIYFEEGFVLPPLAVAVLFGWCSGIFAVLLMLKRYRFIALPRAAQRWFALGIWLVHIAAFVVVLVLMAPYWS